MRIDLNMANDQARQIRMRTDNLRDARALLLSFQQNLNNHWHGQEMIGINNAINSILNRLAASSSELDGIATEINPAAQEVRRQEDLADARAVLAREDANVANLRRAFENTQRQHNVNPNPSSQIELNRAQTSLNNAIRIRNDAAARVRALMR